MQKLVLIACGVLLGFHLGAAAEKEPSTPQVGRGREIFLHSSKGTACGTCHSMAGAGTAVGPNLNTLASTVGPRGLMITFKMTNYAYVKDFKIPGETFPGIEKGKLGDEMEIWDLGQKPPMLRKVSAKQIVTMKQTKTWKHPPAAAGYTSQELADLIGFLKWAATGSVTEIKAADIEAAQ
jgi:hypothetical protein